jgi:Ca2+-binding EF-hand superfamily protein
LIGLRRQFKLFDTNGNGVLEFAEFDQALKDFEINLHPKDVENLFKTFDQNFDATISYPEFLHTLIGQMSRLRYELVEKAFNSVDRGHYGEVSLGDLFAIYDGSRHPDVHVGKITAEDASADFRESFELHHNTIHDYSADANVSKDEFLEFYAYISAMTESDHVFDQAVTGPWNLDSRHNYTDLPYAGCPQSVTNINSHEKWKLDHHKKMFQGNEQDILAPGSSRQDWTTSHRGLYQDPVDTGFQPAGAPTWPAGSNPTWSGALMDEGQRVAELQRKFYEQPEET